MAAAFSPQSCSSDVHPGPLKISPTEESFTPIITCLSAYTQDIFEPACYQLIQHPEYNSTLILRSELLADVEDGFHPSTPTLKDLLPLRQIHRRIVPRRPGRDPPMEQLCTFYAVEKDSSPCAVLLTPLLKPGEVLPYYHPDVEHLAFRYLDESQHLRVETFRSQPADPNGSTTPKLYRTCQHLLSAIHRFSPSYTKNVFHDRLVPRDTYQDVYLLMRERHGARCVQNWKEVTDPRKHVFEDIAIATYLILLWHYTFSCEGTSISSLPKPTDIDAHRPGVFSEWPRPPSGFLDLGCGNGLLTHILIFEGYDGLGLDVRSRQSWAHYDEATQNSLKTCAIDPTSSELIVDGKPHTTPGSFLIGNHADELTPWLPVLSRIWNSTGYLSIPCCSWAWDTKWSRGYADVHLDHEDGNQEDGQDGEASQDGATDLARIGLDDGRSGTTSTYAQYRAWVASLSVKCGWVLECDVLRIPSTRNWAVIGRRLDEKRSEQGLLYAEAVVGMIRDRGSFQARKPEGKAGLEH